MSVLRSLVSPRVTMKTVVLSPSSNISLIDTPRPQIQENQALARTWGCGLCGTDLLKINLRLLKQATVLGHEWVGEIREIGKNVHGFAVGDRIVAAHHVPCFNCYYCHHDAHSMCEVFKKSNFVPGGFADSIVLSKEHLEHVTFKIPPDMPLDEAIFTEPLACCLRCVNKLPLWPKDVIVIVGLGSIGLMMASLLKRLECQVIGVDLDEARCGFSKNFGVNHTFTSFGENFKSLLRTLTNHRNADGVIFTAGPATLLNDSLGWLRNGGFVNLFSHLGGEVGPIDTSTLYHREIQIISSYSSTPETLRQSFDILKNENLQLRRMFAPPYAPEDFADAVSAVNQRRIYKALIRF